MRNILLLLCSLARSADVLPPAAASLSVGASTRRSVTLTWTAPGDDGSTGTAASYDLRYSNIGPIDTLAKFNAAVSVLSLPAPRAAGQAEAFTVTSLAADTTYFFALRSFDEAPNASNLSNTPSAWTWTLAAPMEVAGLRGVRDTGTNAFALSWSAVTKNADGSNVDQDFNRYSVWRATSIWGPFQALADVSTNTLGYAHPGSLAAYACYRVTAGDVYGSTSAVGPSMDNTAEMRLVFFSNDNGARIEVPAASQGVLGDLRLIWTRDAGEEAGRVVRSYTLSTSGADIVFPHPGAALVLSAPGGFSADRLAVFRFNGVDYTKIGGTSRMAAQAVGTELEVQVTQLGKYRLQQSMRMAGFAVTQVVPKKVFTPNGDGVNDAIEIFFENPGDEVASGDVFDLSGVRVAGLRRGTTGDSLVWDGNDASGRPARLGVYIYQVRVGSETRSGTVVLAR